MIIFQSHATETVSQLIVQNLKYKDFSNLDQALQHLQYRGKETEVELQNLISNNIVYFVVLNLFKQKIQSTLIDGALSTDVELCTQSREKVIEREYFRYV